MEDYDLRAERGERQTRTKHSIDCAVRPQEGGTPQAWVGVGAAGNERAVYYSDRDKTCKFV